MKAHPLQREFWPTGSAGTGEHLKADGIEQVLSHTPDDYAAEFLHAIAGYSAGQEFTSEHITALVGPPPGHPNTVGALISTAVKMGLMVSTGKFVKARRAIRHAGKSEVWRRL